ncbi:Hypothetical predicted protein [Olea europaea subsp. europaea]|uniref:Uncharacterized protein n=1 Tax=Olea europaea subsp. europaea TaxID=158383 RepID=A0A8S0SIG3_OLEEU|nr:Hypothetical predicted protein [Olea europaea subsp. europaea]
MSVATEIKNFVGGKVNAEKKDEDEVMIVRVIGKGEILGIGNVGVILRGGVPVVVAATLVVKGSMRGSSVAGLGPEET